MTEVKSPEVAAVRRDLRDIETDLLDIRRRFTASLDAYAAALDALTDLANR